MTNVIVFTTHFGPIKDTLKRPTVVNPNCRYVCWTDKPLNPGVWEIRQSQPGENPDLMCRQIKLQASVMFPVTGQVSLWLDCSFRLDIDPEILVQYYLPDDADMAAFESPFRNNIRQEAQAILPNQDATTLRNLLDTYLEEGFNIEGSEKLTAGGLLIRRNSPKLRAFEHIWWTEYRRWYPGCNRDMMTIDYAIWKSNLNVRHVGGHYKDNQYAKFFKDQ